MGDITRQQIITAPQGTTMIRPIQISDQNVITMNGAAIPAGSANWQQVKTTGQPMTTGTTTYYPQYELKVENKKPGISANQMPIQVTTANVIDVKNITPLPQAVLSQCNNTTWGTTMSTQAPPSVVANADAGWSTIKWENAPSTVVQKSTINTAGLQFVSAPPQAQPITQVGGMNVVIHGGRKTGTIIETFKCEVCNQVFQSMAALQHHVNTIHEVQPQVANFGKKGQRKGFIPATLQCEYKYSGASLADSLTGIAVQNIQPIVGKNGKIKKEKRRNWQCDICQNRFSRKDHLAKHVAAVHEKIRPFECTTCGQKFSQKHHLRAHILARHEDDKTAAKAFACQQCQKRFTRNDHLERHIESVHEKRKQFECAVCAHQFARKHHLSKHILAVHAKVKPYGCHLCDQSFLQRHHLGAHIMSVHQPPVHEEEDGTKTYVCAICSHRFKRKDHLKKHVETVHEKARAFACQLCERRFGQKYHLAIHVSAVHEGKKPFSCDMCSHKSARKASLQRHMKTVHNVPLPGEIKQQQQNQVQLQQPQHVLIQAQGAQPQHVTVLQAHPGDQLQPGQSLPIVTTVNPQATTGTPQTVTVTVTPTVAVANQ